MKNRPTTYAKHVGRVPGPDDVQLDIFSTAAPTAHKRRSRMRRPAAHAHVEAHEPLPGWSALAVEAIRIFILTTAPRERFTFEALRLKVEAGLPAPSDLRAWGNIPRMCVAAGILAKVKGKYAPALSSNGSPKQVYERGARA